jgi:hypothetical protein
MTARADGIEPQHAFRLIDGPVFIDIGGRADQYQSAGREARCNKPAVAGGQDLRDQSNVVAFLDEVRAPIRR